MFAYRRIMVTPVLALLAAGLVTAQEPPREPAAGPQRQPGQMMPRMDMMGPRAEMGWEMLAGAMAFQPARLIGRRAMLQLTPEQVSRLEALSQEAARARTQADSVGRLQADQLRELWNAPAPDLAQLRSRAQAAMQARQAGALAGLEAAAKAKAVLTPEQRGRVAGWADGARMRMGQRMNRPGRPGFGQRRMPPMGPRMPD